MLETARWDVLDFRGGSSMDFFASKKNFAAMLEWPGVEGHTELVPNEITCAKRMLKRMQPGK